MTKFNRNNFKIKPVEYKVAMELIVKYHYLHRKAPCSQAFGLFQTDTVNEQPFEAVENEQLSLFGVASELNERLIGVVTYGTPASRSLQRGLCGDEEANNVMELTRLWIEDETPKNSESYLIANSMKLVEKEIIVSYAEVEQGHLGIVYQATNWIYTGLSAKRADWKVDGIDGKHTRHLFDSYGGINKAKEILGSKMIPKQRPRKHRYVFFNTNKRRRKQLLKKLRYPIEKYPKTT